MDAFQEELGFIKSSLQGWSQVKCSDVKFEVCGMGNSRQTYRVVDQSKISSPNPIILRKFIREPEARELTSFEKMSSAGLGPKILASDTEKGLRIEQYFNSRNMLNYEINQKNYRRKLASKLASVHLLGSLKAGTRKSYIDAAVDRFLNDAVDNCDPNKYEDEQSVQTVNQLRYLFTPTEIEFVLNLVRPLNLVWSHNDIWTGNILVTEPDDQVLVIDYEVTDYNFRGYDIGKLMMEVLYSRHEGSPHYDFLSVDNLPSKEDMIDFMKCYLLAAEGHSIVDNNDQEIEDKSKLISNFEEKVTELYKEVEIGLLCAGFYSAILGMWIGRKITSMDFILFAKHGEIMYAEFKKRFFKE
ncbi:choline/ethanolamine kinase [Acrasis kona]|uniref:Choline/ethanolamine kinase n=1 Tax=Acrasis kona TaxID=1008807 RepID=A0AAW2ZHI1_9EUKA